MGWGRVGESKSALATDEAHLPQFKEVKTPARTLGHQTGRASSRPRRAAAPCRSDSRSTSKAVYGRNVKCAISTYCNMCVRIYVLPSRSKKNVASNLCSYSPTAMQRKSTMSFRSISLDDRSIAFNERAASSRLLFRLKLFPGCVLLGPSFAGRPTWIVVIGREGGVRA